MHQDGENTSHYVDSVGYREIPEFTKELSVSAENSPEKSRLERFESLPEAMAKFTEYRGKETEDKPDMARATLGFSVNGSEFDLIHVRNHDISLYMDRFDALYGQGKMEYLMPTASQKHIVEDVPFGVGKSVHRHQKPDNGQRRNRACLPSGRPPYQYSGSH